MFSLSCIEILSLISCFAEIFRFWDVWAHEFMLTFMSSGVVYGGFRMITLDFLETDLLLFSEVCNSTCWNIYGFEVGGAGDAMSLEMV